MKNKSKQHGGARKGAGRKPNPEKGLPVAKICAIALYPAQIEKLKRLARRAGVSMSAWVQNQIDIS